MEQVLLSRKEKISFYSTGVIPLVLLSAFFWGIKLHLLSLCFFFVSYSWNFSLLAPNFEFKASSKQYKYSFFRLVLNMNKFFKALFEDTLPMTLVRSISPLCFCLILFLLAGLNGNPLMGVMGSLAFELIYIFYSEKKLRDKIFNESH